MTITEDKQDPATATLTFTDYQASGFYFDLDVPIYSTDIVITEANVNGSDDTDCSPINESDDITDSNEVTISAGTTSGSAVGNSPMTCGTHSWKRVNHIEINGVSKSNGQTIMVGDTLVTIVIDLSCQTPYAC